MTKHLHFRLPDIPPPIHLPNSDLNREKEEQHPSQVTQ